MILECKKIIIEGLDGKQMGDYTISGVIASVIAGDEIGLDPAQAMVLCTEMYNKESIDIEKTTFDKIKIGMTNTKRFPPLAKGQVLEFLKGLK